MTVAQETADQLTGPHQQVLDGLVEADRGTLSRLVAEDCQMGPKRFLICRQDCIDSHHSGVYEQVLRQVEHPELTIRDDLAVRCDLQRSECLFRGETIAGLFGVLNVSAHTDAGWRLVAIQHTAVAPEAA